MAKYKQNTYACFSSNLHFAAGIKLMECKHSLYIVAT